MQQDLSLTATSRRGFMQQASLLVAGPAALVLGRARGAETGFIVGETAFGKIRGVENQGIKIFKGVPYGANTAGENRFMPPSDPAKWAGVRDALHYGPSTPQSGPSEQRSGASRAIDDNRPAESEDCLVLNIWTPALKDGRKRPVMFWCHGGGFVSGSGSAPGYDGTNLARRGDVVVVTINHRLNALGFTYFGELAGSGFAQSGDVGMLDIVHALRWVRDNIEQFGGDPNTVMIFGQSGGGRKVGTLLAMPSAKGLFHRAIIESGPTIKLVEREQATRDAEALLKALGLNKNQVREAQKLPVDRIMAAYFQVVRSMRGADQMTEGFSPTVDGEAIPHHPFYPKASAISADVPVMAGCTRTEMTLMHMNDPSAFSLDEAGMRERVKATVGAADADRLIEVYQKANPGASPSDIFFLIDSDHRYGAPMMKIEELRSALGRGPVYAYYFTWETPVDGGRLRSPHTMEIPFAFDNVKISARMTGGGPDAMALADKVSDAWIAFARTGNPNTGKLPDWPAFNAKDRATMVISNESKVEKDPIREQRLAMFGDLHFT
ncbi:MAG TPA: carboxylesterase/lipase family protein [Bryobacteraceae bacterium]|nr:carboxylesterase/lipase family protein [Bryobacteraceae bacterium]